MGEPVMREKELLNEIKEIFEHTSGRLSVSNVTSMLRKKYQMGRNKKFVSDRKIRSLIIDPSQHRTGTL